MNPQRLAIFAWVLLIASLGCVSTHSSDLTYGAREKTIEILPWKTTGPRTFGELPDPSDPLEAWFVRAVDWFEADGPARMMGIEDARLAGDLNRAREQSTALLRVTRHKAMDSLFESLPAKVSIPNVVHYFVARFDGILVAQRFDANRSDSLQLDPRLVVTSE